MLWQLMSTVETDLHINNLQGAVCQSVLPSMEPETLIYRN